MITKDYERFFKVVLEDFQKQSITQLEKLLSTLDLEPTLILMQENLTAEPLVQIIKSDLEDEDKILAPGAPISPHS